ncbi:hypothetical protein CL639_001745 [bacterium]|nr:hypothetical protein [bacterium]
MSESWDKRPDWIMPDKTVQDELGSTPLNKALITGFNLSYSAKQVEKLIESKGLKYTKVRNKSKQKLLNYNFEGTLFDTMNFFTYLETDSAVDFFDGSMISSRVAFKASNDENLEEIVNSVYKIIVDKYSLPKEENSIYSFQNYKWKISDLEVFLFIDRENKRVFVSEINSRIEESRSFQEFKDTYINVYETYEEQIRGGKR